MPLTRSRFPPTEIQKTVCVVDDDESVAGSLRALLETFGFKVRLYTSGAEFLADERGRLAACLIIDQHMPGISGLDVVDSLRKQGVQIPTILISGCLDGSVRQRAAHLGIRELLDKLLLQAVVELIRTTLADVAECPLGRISCPTTFFAMSLRSAGSIRSHWWD
jgi:two-component system, LuxR family, response regulator FixJ